VESEKKTDPPPGHESKGSERSSVDRISSRVSGKPKIDFNAPFVLLFAAIGLVAMILGSLTGGKFVSQILELEGTWRPASMLFYFQLLFHPLGHATWAQYFGNFTIILLVGPLLEEKYGSLFLTIAALITAVITGLAHVILFNSGLLGASGIAFMMILLTSLANFKKNTIPLTFIIVAILFMGREIAASFREDSLSQFAHIIGGACGAAIGFYRDRK